MAPLFGVLFLVLMPMCFTQYAIYVEPGGTLELTGTGNSYHVFHTVGGNRVSYRGPDESNVNSLLNILANSQSYKDEQAKRLNPPAHVPSCAMKQRNFSLILRLFDYRSNISHLVVPLYVKAYRLIHYDLLHTLLNVNASGIFQTNELTSKLSSTVSTLNITLHRAVLACTLIKNLAAHAEGTTILSMDDVESTVRSHETCLAEFHASLTGLQSRLGLANSHNQQIQADYSHALQLYNEATERYEDCWFFCGDLEDAMNTARTSLVTTQHRKTEAAKYTGNLTKDIISLETDVQHYRKELDFKKNALQSIRQQQSKLATVMKELKEALKHVTDFHDVFDSRSTFNSIVQNLFTLDTVIIPLNAIYEVMQENYKMAPFAGGLISTDTINQFKLKLNILKVKAEEMDQNLFNNNYEDYD
ncbi:unnamed protein product [Didymodactylos carnosus]|uniref:Uncharacterized protein n=1 Tax=Didymodactylos carnosus TaxID=1234261 RepID=A0A813UJJ3_9BILA|nr:unnamed protein product [Didymodactylos carnosus]CAF1332935.1 unnamed protein product [Didymodactylos carnosus]CAF3617085.1 unnamed protein product [Didymodactylos carnosus]CAF4144202.1 unnamed protein product [Didymodactylos carnosus]